MSNTNCQELSDVSFGCRHLSKLGTLNDASTAFFLGLQNGLEQTSWTYWLLVYRSCSSCPLIIITSESKHCCVPPHTSLLAGCCIDQNDWSIPIKRLFALGFAGFGFTFEGVVYGKRKWRHISQNVRSVLHVAYVVYVCLNSHQAA